MQANLILTCAGKSLRFSDSKPKWAQTHPSGNLMACEALKGLGFEFKLYLAINSNTSLTKESITRAFESAGYEIEGIIVVDTTSQVDTVKACVDKWGFSRFIVRDCDSFISCKAPASGNFITFFNATGSSINILNKSTIHVIAGHVTSIREKSSHSPLISVGLYGFETKDFLEAYNRTVIDHRECYLSDVYNEIKSPIAAVECSSYQDWGTKEDWMRFKDNYATLFVDIDGTLVKSSHRDFYPRWGETEIIKENADFINKCYESGTKQVILTTARDETYRKITEEQLKGKVKYHRMIMGLYCAKRIIINDYESSSGMIGCREINLPRNSNQLALEYRARIGY